MCIDWCACSFCARRWQCRALQPACASLSVLWGWCVALLEGTDSMIPPHSSLSLSFCISLSLSLDGALTLPWAAIHTTETCSGPWKAASLCSPGCLPLLMANSLMPSHEIWLRAIYGLAFAKANKRPHPLMACMLPVCPPQLTMQRSALRFLLPLTVTMLWFTLCDYCDLDRVIFNFQWFFMLLSTGKHFGIIHLIKNKIYHTKLKRPSLLLLL